MNSKNKKQKTIVYLATYFHPFIGGAEHTTLELALQAVKDGYDVHVITSDQQNGQKLTNYEYEYKGIKIHRMKTWFRFSLNLVFYPSLLIKLLKIDADIISTNYLGITWHDFCLIIKKFISPKTKFINMPIDEFMGHNNYPAYQKVIKFLYTKVQRIFVNWLYDAFVQINPNQYVWMKRDFNIPKENINYIPVGIPGKYLKRHNTDVVESKYDLRDKFVISYIGRIEEYKGIKYVIQILPDLVKKYPNIIYIVGGRPTSHQEQLKVLVKNLDLSKHVIFAGEITDEEKFEILAVSDIFASPSSSEGFGITYLEAMSQGNAIITAVNEGSKFLITNGENGFVSKQSDLETLKYNLLNLIKNLKLLNKIQQNNLIFVKSYTWESIGEEKYLPLIQKILGH